MRTDGYRVSVNIIDSRYSEYPAAAVVSKATLVYLSCRVTWPSITMITSITMRK